VVNDWRESSAFGSCQENNERGKSPIGLDMEKGGGGILIAHCGIRWNYLHSIKAQHICPEFFGRIEMVIQYLREYNISSQLWIKREIFMWGACLAVVGVLIVVVAISSIAYYSKRVRKNGKS